MSTPTTDTTIAAASVDAAVVDLVSAGRHVSSGQYLAGLMAAAQLDTAGTPRRLPTDLFPQADPVVVQEVWDRACAVAWRAAQFAAQPWLYRDTLASLQRQLEEAGHVAMAGMVGRSRELAVRARNDVVEGPASPDMA